MRQLSELEILAKLIEFDTNSKDQKKYKKIASFIKQVVLDNNGIANIYSPKNKEKPNIIAYFDFNKKETIGFNAHYDTVPVNKSEWKTDPFKLSIIGNKAFGRGASDDKSGIAIALSLIQNIKSNANIELIFTCDEEIGSDDGLKWLIKNKRKELKSNSIIVLDCEDKITIGASGVSSGKITIKGKEVHAGFPFLGKNAIELSLPFLEELNRFQKIIDQKSKYYGDKSRKIYNRFSITMINSGIKENLIPGMLEARFDLRSNPETDLNILMNKFKNYFNSIKNKYKINAELKFLEFHNGYVADMNSKIIKKLIETAKQKKVYASFGGLDASFFNQVGIPTVCYGAQNMSIHKSNEYVDINKISKIKKQLFKILENF